MSKLIEDEVVKMQFDNKGFESGVKQSMSTLDKLKAALHFKDINMTPLEKAFSQAESTATRAGFHIRDVWLKMSEVFEYQIARRIVDAGEKITKALTIEGAMDGFNEYELKMGSIQTIMAGTGESLATVNKYLEELNTYSDKTIYSFKDMTDNIGKFTNAGVKLDDAVNAIKGIANEAAVSGANANEASRAMYNFSQALSSGYVKLIDWKSIENANMATVEFKKTLLEVADGLGTVKKNADGTYDSLTVNAQGKASEAFNAMKGFNDSLQAQWMNTEVLTKALKIYATDVRDLTEDEKKLYEQELASIGISPEQIQKFEQLGIKAANAATEIKTFSMLMDTLKEAIGSGWAMTWQYIIGDFDQAKELWTQVGNAVGGVIDRMSDARNNLLKNGLATGWERLTQVENAAIPATETLRQRLTEAAVAQGKLTEEEAEQLEKTSDWVKSIREKGWLTKDFLMEQLRDYQKYIHSLDEDSKTALSIDDADIKEYDNFIQMMWRGSDYFNDLVDSLDEMGGRENILAGLSNIFSGISEILGRIKNAWSDTFGKMNSKDLKDLTVRFKEFSEKLHLSENALKSIGTVSSLVFKSIKAGLTIVSTAIKGVSKLVLPLLNLADAIFGVIGELIAAITNSDGIIGFADKLEEGGNKLKNGYLAVMQKIADVINKVANAIRNWRESEIFITLSEYSDKAQKSLSNLWEEFKQLPIVKEMMKDFENVSKNVSKAFGEVKKKFDSFFKTTKQAVSLESLNAVLTKIYHSLKNFKTILSDVKNNFVNFFKEVKSGKNIVDSFKDNFKDVIDFFKNLKESISDFFDKIFGDGDTSKFQELADAIHGFFETLDSDKVTAIVLTTVFGLFAINLLRLTNAMSDAVMAISGTFNTLKMVINSYMKRQKSVLLQIAEAIVIVAGAIYVLSTIDGPKLKKAMTALYAITGCIAALLVITTIVTKIANSGMPDTSKISRLAEMTFSLISLSGTLVLATFALKKISELDIDKSIIKKAGAVVGVIGVLAGIAAILSKIKIPGGDKSGIVKVSITMVAIAGALYIIAKAMEKVHAVAGDGEALKETANSMLKMMAGLAAISLAAGSIGGFSALGILAVVILFEKLMPRIEKIVNYDYTNIKKGLEGNEEILKSIGAMAGVMLVIGGLFGKGFSKMGTGLIKMIAVMGVMVILAKYSSTLNSSQISKGIGFVKELASMLSVMVVCVGLYNLMSKMDKTQKGGLGLGAFIGIALTLSAMALIAKSVKNMDSASLSKGIKFIGALVLLVDSMFLVSGLAGKSGASSFKNLALILSGIAFILGLMVTLSIIKDKSSLYAAMGAVAVVLLSLGTVFTAVSKINSEAIKTERGFKRSGTQSGPIVAVLLGVATVIGGMVWLSKQPFKNIIAASAGITVALIAFAAVMKTLSRIGAVAEATNRKRVYTIISAIAGVAVVTAAIAWLAKKGGDARQMGTAAASITVGLVGLAACIKALGAISGTARSAKTNYLKIFATLGAAVVALAAVMGAIKFLTTFGGDPQKMIAASTAITIGLVGVAICCTAMGYAGKLCENANWKTAGESILGAIVAMGAVAFAIGKLSSTNVDSKRFIDSALAIGIATIAVGASAVLMGIAATIAKNSNWKSAGTIIGGAVIAMAAVAGALYLLGSNLSAEQAQNISNMAPAFAKIMTAFGIMCIAMSAAAQIGSGASGLVPALLAGLAGLATIVGVAIGLGALFEKFEGLETKLDRGLDSLVNIFTKIGEAIGGLIGGFVGKLSEELISGIGTGLNTLMDDSHLGGFFKKIEKVDQKAIDGAKNVAGVISAWIGVGWDQFWSSLLGVDVDFDKFNFEEIGKMIHTFVESVKDLTEDDLSKANIASNIASSIAVLSTSLPKSGGILEFFTGKTESLKDFGEGLKSFAQGIKEFAENSRGIVEEDVDNIRRVVSASEIISGFSKTLQSYGGLKGLVFGNKQTIDEFGEAIVAFVENLVKFVTKSRELESAGSDYPDLIQRVADSVEPLNALSKNLDVVGGLFSKVVGHSDLKTFSTTFVPFAENLYDFVTYVRDNLSWDFESYINTVTNAVYPLANLAQKLSEKKETFLGIGTLDLDEFGKQIKKFGSKIADFCKDNTGIDYTPIMQMTNIIDPLMQLSALNLNAAGIQSIVDSLNSIAKVSLVDVSNTFTTDITVINAILALITKMKNTIVAQTEATKATFNKFGVDLTEAIKNGIESGESSYVDGAISNLITAIKNKLSSETLSSNFETYGKNVAIGLANGIDANASSAVAAAERMASAVAAATKKGLDERSPSKLTKLYGKYWDEGLAIGIDENTGSVVRSVNTLSDAVISSTKSIITNIKNVLDTDMNFEPTIRPVVDTSDVEEKSKQINKMLSVDTKTANKASMSFNASDLSLLRSVSSAFNFTANARKLDAQNEARKDKSNSESIGGLGTTFIQNNYSPKALSRIEIYRDTRNLFSQAKGALS